ncbi:hypothetical protein V6N11_030644 [Hibiscus sabdariffa]|uniref:Uncharacterized protein n=1 Tax=Hibiscus sabdariffa TaxID=183260 RepID=A0ABR2NMV4_9ROSI
MLVSVGNELEDVSVVEARAILLENALGTLIEIILLPYLHSFQGNEDILSDQVVKLLSLVSLLCGFHLIGYDDDDDGL